MPRARWLAVKLAALATATVLLTAGFSAGTSWYRQPLDLVTGRFQLDGLDVSGIAPLGYALFAFALGAAAGALLRRSLPAVGVALLVFVAVRITVGGFLRPHYRPPITLNEVIPAGSGAVRIGTGNLRDWILDEGIVDAGGNRLRELGITIMEHKAAEAGTDPGTYLHDNGYHRWVVYHPADRYWPFQLTETGIFFALAALVLALLVWRVRRRAF